MSLPTAEGRKLAAEAFDVFRNNVDLLELATKSLQMTIESLESQLQQEQARSKRYEKALKDILDYGKALQPSPGHPVTFNACSIAYEALHPYGATEGK